MEPAVASTSARADSESPSPRDSAILIDPAVSSSDSESPSPRDPPAPPTSSRTRRFNLSLNEINDILWDEESADESADSIDDDDDEDDDDEELEEEADDIEYFYSPPPSAKVAPAPLLPRRQRPTARQLTAGRLTRRQLFAPLPTAGRLTRRRLFAPLPDEEAPAPRRSPRLRRLFAPLPDDDLDNPIDDDLDDPPAYDSDTDDAPRPQPDTDDAPRPQPDTDDAPRPQPASPGRLAGRARVLARRRQARGRGRGRGRGQGGPGRRGRNRPFHHVDSDGDDLDEWTLLDRDIHHLPTTFAYTGPADAPSFVHPRTYGETMDSYTPLDFFSLFFTLDLWQMISDETNLYTREIISKKTPLPPRSAWKRWYATSAEEMRVFHGIVLYMGIERNKNFLDFFSTAPIRSSNIALKCFNRERCTQIFWGLHVGRANAEHTQFESRSSKVGSVIDYLQERFFRYYVPGAHLSADESTVPFKGRIGFAIYNPLKPVKVGMRIVDVADASTGYMLRMIPYYGAESNETLPFPEHAWATRIILTLTDYIIRHYQYSGFHIFTDRLYTSVTLAKELLRWQCHLTGTLNPARTFSPTAVKVGNLRLGKDESVNYICNNRFNVNAWKDKRDVKTLSTFYGSATEEHTRKYKGNKPDEIVHKPIVISEYTKYMGGVDRHDHLTTSYAFLQKTLK